MLRTAIRAAFLALSACAVIPDSEPPASGSTLVLDGASAEARTRDALERIEALNPRLNAVIAVDPTALDQARISTVSPRARGAVRHADPDKGNIRPTGTCPPPRQPGARQNVTTEREDGGKACARREP